MIDGRVGSDRTPRAISEARRPRSRSVILVRSKSPSRSGPGDETTMNEHPDPEAAMANAPSRPESPPLEMNV